MARPRKDANGNAPNTRERVIALNKERPALTMTEVAAHVKVSRQRVKQIADEEKLVFPGFHATRGAANIDELERPTPAEIKQWRRDYDVTAEAFAAMVGVAADTVNRWERGAMMPPRMLRLALRWYSKTRKKRNVA